MSAPLDRRGMISATAAFVLWGVMPLYWHLLKSVPSLQIIAHRIVWSALLVAGWLTWRYGRSWLRETLRHPRAAWMLALSGIFIAFNWGLYIWRSMPAMWLKPASAISSIHCSMLFWALPCWAND